MPRITGAAHPSGFTAMGMAECDACRRGYGRDVKGKKPRSQGAGRQPSHSRLPKMLFPSGVRQANVGNFLKTRTSAYRGGGGGLVPSQIGCWKFGGSPWISHGKFSGHSQKTSLNPLAPKARKQNFDLDPGFRVGKLAAKLKRQISHTNLIWLPIPPPPLYTQKSNRHTYPPFIQTPPPNCCNHEQGLTFHSHPQNSPPPPTHPLRLTNPDFDQPKQVTQRAWQWTPVVHHSRQPAFLEPLRSLHPQHSLDAVPCACRQQAAKLVRSRFSL